jgi:hypothetical protein
MQVSLKPGTDLDAGGLTPSLSTAVTKASFVPWRRAVLLASTTSERPRRRGVTLLATLLTVTGVVGCSVHVSIGGSPAVPRHTVESEIATTLAREVHEPAPTVVCPGDLKAKVGTVMYCSLTAQGSTIGLPVRVQVYAVSGSNVHFHIQVSETPGHFTAPG